MPELTVKHIIEEVIPGRISANPQLRTEINAVIVFDVTGQNGGQWTLDMTRDAGWVKPGVDGVTAKMTLTVSDSDFLAVCTKKMNAQIAAVSGKIKFKPMDVNLAMKLGKLLG